MILACRHARAAENSRGVGDVDVRLTTGSNERIPSPPPFRVNGAHCPRRHHFPAVFSRRVRSSVISPDKALNRRLLHADLPHVGILLGLDGKHLRLHGLEVPPRFHSFRSGRRGRPAQNHNSNNTENNAPPKASHSMRTSPVSRRTERKIRRTFSEEARHCCKASWIFWAQTVHR